MATSFLGELSLSRRANNFDVVVSSEIDKNLRAAGCDGTAFGNYEVIDIHGLKALAPSFQSRLQEYNIVFTVFGPLYTFSKSFVSVVGFAQPWIVHPSNEEYLRLGLFARFRTRLKFMIQSWFFRRADALVVEAPHVKQGLKTLGWQVPIDVVSNCISSMYLDDSRWLPVDIPDLSGPRLGIVTRDYPHKNLRVLPEVKRLLKTLYGLDVDFIVTLTEEEWAARDERFRLSLTNVGPLSVAQCPSFYRQLDGVIFPSLLECFSATPLEALFMGLPLFASDRGFVRDVCGDVAHYFEPTDPLDIARCIASYFSVSPAPSRRVELPAEYLQPALRAHRYLEIIDRYTHSS